jgi:hypothetical protein
MAALANVLLSTIAGGKILTSSATVGSDKTFAPEGWKPGNVASWVDRSGGIPLLYPRITFALRPPARDSRVYRVAAKLYLPVGETIDPAVGIFGPRLAYDLQMHLDLLIPERATAAERTAFISLIRTFLCSSVAASDLVPDDTTGSPIPTAVANLEDVY